MACDENPIALNILVAYPYLKADMLGVLSANADVLRLVVDSGAFTAYKSGKTIELDDYCRFLEGLRVPVWRYFTLDKIGDPAGTLENYQKMLDRGFTPVPIFTRGEDPSVLDDFYRTSDVVGVGGLVGTSGSKGFVNGVMGLIAGRRAHWLGFADHAFMCVYRPYMADCSTWENGAKFGYARVYIGGRFVSVRRSDFIRRPDSEMLAKIKFLGVDPYELRNAEAWHGGASPVRALGASSGVAYSVDVQRNLGTMLFNAVAAPYGATLLADGYRNLQRMKVVP